MRSNKTSSQSTLSQAPRTRHRHRILFNRIFCWFFSELSLNFVRVLMWVQLLLLFLLLLFAVISIRAHNATTFCINYQFNSLLLPLISRFLSFSSIKMNKDREREREWRQREEENNKHTEIMHECYLFVAFGPRTTTRQCFIWQRGWWPVSNSACCSEVHISPPSTALQKVYTH